MGLVAFDASGQVEPGLAESWIVTDDGLSYIFRIALARWPDGSEVTAPQVAASLNRALAPESRNALHPLLSAIDRVVAMTGHVVEVRLRVPRPNLLQLLAQPQLGIRRSGAGAGPWRARPIAPNAYQLTQTEIEDAADEDSGGRAARITATARGERAAMAIARFAAGQSQLVLGGRAADWPILSAAQIPANRIRVDLAEGLFGLAISDRATWLKEADLREALAMAIDRGAMVGALGIPRWSPAETLLGSQMDSAQPPALPTWRGLTPADRRATAAARIASWRGSRGAPPPLRIALPAGPGMTLLFARLAADWRAIGVEAVRLPADSRDADMRLIDEVTPNTSANWYLTRTACQAGVACAQAGEAALLASRAAPSFALRARLLAEADVAQARASGFITLAQPVRWSLVAPSLTEFRPNAFAVHPHIHLRRPVN